MSLGWVLVVIAAGFMVVHSAPPSSHRVRRVIGGHEVAEVNWPWLVSVKGKIPDRTFLGIPLSYRNYYCGGSLLNDRWVLTAAHCFPVELSGALRPSYWHIHLGDIELTTGLFDRMLRVVGDFFNVNSWRKWNIPGDKILLHPQYDAESYLLNDIALIKLEEAVPTSSDEIPEIQPARLVNTNVTSFPADNQDCIMKGWGCTAGDGSVTDTARQVVLPKVSDSRCRRFWGIQATTLLCAGYNLGNRGICPDDSGGPLVCQRNGTWLQVGIASFTSVNRPGNVPGEFTRVSYYVDWINSMIARN